MLAAFAFAPVVAIALPSASPCILSEPIVCILPGPAAPSALVVLTIPAGSSAERAGEHGVAHFLEHLTFRNRDVENGEATSGAVGIDRYGNAYTTPFATTYHWTVPPERAEEAIARALRVLAPLDVSESVADQERAIVRREREQRKATADAKRSIAVSAALYDGTPLARTVIGTSDEIDALTLEAARAFHERHYHPGEAVLVVAGAIDRETLTTALDDIRNPPSAIAPVEDALSRAGTAVVRSDESFSPTTLDSRKPTRLVVRGPFGAPARTMDAVVLTERPDVARTDATDLATGELLEAFLNSGLEGSPRVALEKGRGRVPEAVGDKVRDASFLIDEVVPGLLYLGVTIGLRPTIEGNAVTPALDTAWRAWEDEWTALRANGLPDGVFERLRGRIVADIARERADAIQSAWSLIGWLEAGASADDWATYPATVKALTEGDVDALLGRLDAPQRSVITDTLPATGTVVIEPTPTNTLGSETADAFAR